MRQSNILPLRRQVFAIDVHRFYGQNGVRLIYADVNGAEQGRKAPGRIQLFKENEGADEHQKAVRQLHGAAEVKDDGRGADGNAGELVDDELRQHMDIKECNRGLVKKRRLLSESEKRITELDMILKRLYEDSISGKLTDERFHKLSTDYEAEQAGLQAQAAILREEIKEAEGKSANVDRFLSVVRQYTDIPELTPRILHEFVEKIVIHAATDPHSKINRRQEVDIYYKGIGILEMSKVFDSRQK